MYQVLYRKWRPKKFSEVVGQPQVTVTLKNELKSGRVAHAYLFTGSRGTGKTTCAKILAKAVNCLNPVDGDPCGECEICRSADNGSLMDIVEIDAASNNGVENIRALREEANFTPAVAKYRVYIIDEVHMLSAGAFNALLKTLEEPPPHVIFILATTEVQKLPATIRSRCQRFDFHRIASKDIADRLTYVAEQEKASIEPQAALLIARLSDGALRDALSLLDQCFSRSKNVTEQVVVESAGLVGSDYLFALTDAVKDGDSAHALEIIDHLYRDSMDMARLCEELSSHFRALMLIHVMKDAREILAVPESRYMELEKQSQAVPLPTVLHGMEVMQRALGEMGRGADRRTTFELSMLRLCSPKLDSSPAALLRRVEALEQGIPEKSRPDAGTLPTISRDSAVSPDTGEKKRQNSSEPPAARKQDAEVRFSDLQKNAKKLSEWPEILETVRQTSPSVGTALSGSAGYVSGGYVLIDAPNQIAFQLLRRAEQRDKMRAAIQKITGRAFRLGPYRKPQERAEGKDPLLQLAEDARKAGIQVEKKEEESKT